MRTPDPVSSISERLEMVPADAGLAIILRHAEREEIPAGTFGVDVPLTGRGVLSARRLGATLSKRNRQAAITTSPVLRCVATAQEILGGGGWPGEVDTDWRLGDPGPFVVDPEAAGAAFLHVGAAEIVQRQLSNGEPPAGMRETSDGVNLLLNLAATNLSANGSMNLFVTHDSVLAVLVAHLYGLSTGEICWPGYLDSLLLWRSSKRLYFAWPCLNKGSYPMSR